MQFTARSPGPRALPGPAEVSLQLRPQLLLNFSCSASRHPLPRSPINPSLRLCFWGLEAGGENQVTGQASQTGETCMRAQGISSLDAWQLESLALVSEERGLRSREMPALTKALLGEGAPCPPPRPQAQLRSKPCLIKPIDHTHLTGDSTCWAQTVTSARHTGAQARGAKGPAGMGSPTSR